MKRNTSLLPKKCSENHSDLKERPRCLTIIVSVTSALAAGTVNGILGTGGGIVLAYLFSYLGIGDEKDSLACAMCVILPVSLISLLTYESGYFASFSHFTATAIPAGAGGLVGAVLSDRVSALFIRKLFAVIVIYSGVTMVL